MVKTSPILVFELKFCNTKKIVNALENEKRKWMDTRAPLC
jgi:hypothetical protein